MEYVYGFTNSGETVILYGLNVLKNNINIPGFETTSYNVNSFVLLKVNYSSIGYSVAKLLKEINKSPKEFPVKKLKFNFEFLNEWMNQTAITTETSSSSSENKVTITTDMNRITPKVYVIKDSNEEFSFKNNHKIRVQNAKSERIITEEAEWSVWSKKETLNTLENLMGYIRSFKQLVQLFLNMPLKYNYIEFLWSPQDFEVEIDRYNIVKGRYFFREVGERKTKNPNISFHYTNIIDTFNQTLSNWFEKKELLEFIVNSYLHDLTSNNFIDTMLLNSIRNLEVYHRNFTDSEKEKIVDEKLEGAKTMLIDYINENVSEEYATRFTRNVNYNPDTTLRKRLKDLFNLLPDDFLKDLIKKPEISTKRSLNELITGLIDTRNYLTHGDDEKKYPKRLSDPHEMYKTNEVLKIVIRFYIYKELDVPEEKALENLYQDVYHIKSIF